MEIYQPSEDSYLFKDFLKKELPKLINKNKNLKFLEIGCGSGILSREALRVLPPKNITALDINSTAIKVLKKEPFKTIQSDLFNKLNSKNHKFDIIIFNAPYLPLDPREPKSSRLATTGGKRGDEVALKFLKEAKQYIKKNGKIFLLISSLTPLERIKKFKYKVVARKKLFTEELQILEFN